MCGIAGWINLDGQPAPAGPVAAMTDVLAPRGPDGSGLFCQNQYALGHRRLKIVDLSDHAQQPMVDSQLGLGVVFNGMIYNYKQLRRTLRLKGYRFFSTGDTEVVLKAYHAWGPRCVERFNGMFAFAVWERDTGRVVLARDRLGIKPLYYTQSPGRFRFASTLPALLAAGDIDTGIDPVALNFYLSWRAIVPAPYTILKGVRKLPAATVMTIEPDGTQSQSVYWQPHYNPRPRDQKRPFDYWKHKTLDLLRKSIRRRTTADVPVGVLLSGGIDSSIIVGLLAEAGYPGLKTFSMGFESIGDKAGDEFQYSDIVAKRFGTDHHKIFINADRLLASLEGCVRAMSEPMLHCSNIGFYLLGQEVSKHRKVVQSGQGADEIFGGYNWYPPVFKSDDPANDFIRCNFDRDHAEYARTVNGAMVGQDYARQFVVDHFNRPGADHPLSKALRLDTAVSLVEDPIKRVDNMTMAWGLESRVPFLDHELVEFAASIPAPMQFYGDRWGKRVLQEAARMIIPTEVIDRVKGAFPVPAMLDMRGPVYDLACDILNQPAARQRGLFNPEYVQMLITERHGHATAQGESKLWQIATLEYWLQLQGL